MNVCLRARSCCRSIQQNQFSEEQAVVFNMICEMPLKWPCFQFLPFPPLPYSLKPQSLEISSPRLEDEVSWSFFENENPVGGR